MQSFLIREAKSINHKERIEYGDYQTPRYFCDIVTALIAKDYDPEYVFEPTFGLGNFLDSCRATFKNAAKFYGNEINTEYFNEYKKRKYKNVVLYNENIFGFNHAKIVKEIRDKPLLIIGNPPWATNSKLSSEDLKNIPEKNNDDNLRGIEAITGKSNFDISESIITSLFATYEKSNVLFAFLCKMQVAISIMKKIDNYKLQNIRIYKYSAKKIFGIDADACLFVAASSEASEKVASIYNIDEPENKLYEMGYKDNQFYTRIDKSMSSGHFFMEWHSGVKHDLKNIMELEALGNGIYKNGNGEIIELEDEYIYPLLKSADLKSNKSNNKQKYIIITQNHTNENTAKIEENCPKLWSYLKNNEKYFTQRKSKIYENKPPFSLFGVGPYCFKKYKVAVSSFYKNPAFIFVSSKKPTFFDDTCYFISFDDKEKAIISTVLLNSEECKKMISTMASRESKRYITKEILMRIDFGYILTQYDYERFKKECKSITPKIISKNSFNKYKQTILDYQNLEQIQHH